MGCELQTSVGPLFRADILIVDDVPSNLQVLSRMLRENGYKVRPVTGGPAALQAAGHVVPDLILLDIDMPGMNGFETCERLKADRRLQAVPVIFLSGHAETVNKVRAFSVGGVDFITKPFQLEEVIVRVETHLKLMRLQNELHEHNRNLEARVRQQVQDMTELQMATIFAVAKLAEYRDMETGQHLERVRRYCSLLATQLAGVPALEGRIGDAFIETIYQSSPLHDIGKVGIPDAVLLKPGRLTQEEFEIIKRHTVLGAEALQAVQEKYPQHLFVNMGIEIARSHHERWDGTGYPDGLRGEAIPLSARIMSLADSYDAMVSRRIYKEAMSHEASHAEIAAQSGRQFDPLVVDAFRQLEPEFRRIHSER